MFVSSVLALSAQAFATSSSLSTDELPRVLMSACLDGAAKLSAGQASPIGVDDLPSALRSRLGRPASGQVWKLNSPGRAYLYVLNYQPRPSVSPKVCGLASDEMLPGDAIEQRPTGSSTRHKLRGMEWWRPEDGYVVGATTAGRFNVIQIRWMNDAERLAALDALRVLIGGVPTSKNSNDAPGQQ